MVNDRLDLKVTGDSMSPIIRSGDIVSVDLDVTVYYLGDILLFKDSQSQELTVHRLVDAKAFLTKGDNSYCFDEIGSKIIGKVIAINSYNLIPSKLHQIIALLSRFSNSKNPLRYFLRNLIKWVLIIFCIQKKSYLKDS